MTEITILLGGVLFVIVLAGMMVWLAKQSDKELFFNLNEYEGEIEDERNND